jgi:membrane protease YdiL (CAAX protease family)
MGIELIARILFLLAITVFLSLKKEQHKVEYFPHQTWSAKKLLPVYWVFILVLSTLFLIHRVNPNKALYIILSSAFTLLIFSFLIIFLRRISSEITLTSLEIIGAQKSDLYYLLILIIIQNCILIILLLQNNAAFNFHRIIFILGYFSITLVFWPVIESIFYLGMMFIPVSRIVGLIQGAILVSFLQTLSHFSYNLEELVQNFILFGLLGCYLYIKCKRIIVPVLLHSSINFLSLLKDIRVLFN